MQMEGQRRKVGGGESGEEREVEKGEEGEKGRSRVTKDVPGVAQASSVS